MNKAVKVWALAGIAASVIFTPLASNIAVIYGEAGLIRKDTSFMKAAQEVSNHTDPSWTPAGVILVGLGAVGSALWRRRNQTGPK